MRLERKLNSLYDYGDYINVSRPDEDYEGPPKCIELKVIKCSYSALVVKEDKVPRNITVYRHEVTPS